MTETCPEVNALVDAELSRVPTEYREATKFLAYLRASLALVEDAAIIVCSIPSAFDITAAVGDQLTLIGKRMGFPRCHCDCAVMPVYGFSCEGADPLYPIAGFCETGTWFGCETIANSEICLDDDEVYRGHLLARRYQMMALYDEESLTAAIRHVWGSTAWIAEHRDGFVCLAPGRTLSAAEVRQLRVTLRVLPVAPGITLRMHFDSSLIAGIGTGWGGFCESDWLCPIDVNPYRC